ncbi:MAG TPA: ABC transporter ATP-binding protein [Candidatus Edwardsbacteria bacterium]|nr:ABC transporter ATP-binding protein [Candidatus Edwardsbacteria bacterium]
MSEQRAAGTKPAVVAGPSRGGVGMVIGRPVEKAKDFWGTSRRLASYLRPHQARVAMVFGFAVLGTVFSIVGPKILGKATTKLFDGLIAKYVAFMARQPMPAIDFAYIGHIMLWLLFLYLLSALFTYVQQYQMAGVAQTVVFDLRAEVERKLSRLPLRYYDSHAHGDILSRVTNDVDNISTTLQQSLTQLITSACTIVGVLVMMLTISPLLTLIALVTLPLSFAVTAGIAKYSQKMFAAQQRELGELNGHVEEMYAGHRIVKAFGREAASMERFQEINLKLYGAGWRAQFVSGIIFPMMNFISNLGYVGVCVVGGVMVTKRTIDLGDIQAFIQYMRQFTQPVVQTANIVNILQSTVASAERVFEVLDEQEEEPERADAPAIAEPRGAVRFEHVRFGYRPDKILMHDLSIDVQPGQTIAIVGPTGAGKTTLVNLLLRFYELDGGRITVDGTDIRDLRRGDLRTMFGMVLQDTWLFNGTIRENIAYCCPGAPLEQVKEAAKAAHADHFIRALPQGYDTPLGDEASAISQGERQLLTIARAILADPAILILDEATSSVDTRTEVFIQKAMQRLMHGRTSFVIAHRLSTIRDAELILVMKDGSIIETGTHKQLLARKGFYADLYNSQFTGAFAEETAA